LLGLLTVVQRDTRLRSMSAPQPVTFNHIKHTQQAVLSVIHWLVFDQWFVFEGVVTVEAQLSVALVGFDQNVACFLTIATMTVNYLVVIATYRVIEPNTIVLGLSNFFSIHAALVRADCRDYQGRFDIWRVAIKAKLTDLWFFFGHKKIKNKK
jgi:hypothetical protein